MCLFRDILLQEFVKEKLGAGADDRPCIFVFHGGSGSSPEDIATAVKVHSFQSSDTAKPLCEGTRIVA